MPKQASPQSRVRHSETKIAAVKTFDVATESTLLSSPPTLAPQPCGDLAGHCPGEVLRAESKLNLEYPYISNSPGTPGSPHVGGTV